MVSWKKAFFVALKIVSLEILLSIVFLIINVVYGSSVLTVVTNSYISGRALNLGGVLFSVLILLIIDFCLAILSLAIPIKLLTDLISSETYLLITQGRKDVYSWLCPKCGQMNPQSASFCSSCGTMFKGNPEKSETSEKTVTPNIKPFENKPPEPTPIKTEPPSEPRNPKIIEGVIYLILGASIIFFSIIINIIQIIPKSELFLYFVAPIGLIIIIYSLYFIWKNSKKA